MYTYYNEYPEKLRTWKLFQSINQTRSIEVSVGSQSSIDRLIQDWIKVHDLKISLEKGHFFLQGWRLDNFIKQIIDKAEKEIFVVNPYVELCDLSKLLGKASANRIVVKLLTKNPETEDNNYSIIRKKKCHDTLKKSGVDIFYNDYVHAKIIVVDRLVGVVSSMNFISTSSAGKSWEAGIVTIEQEVVKSITKSILEQLKN